MLEAAPKQRGVRKHRRKSGRKWPIYVICLCALLVAGAIGRTAYRSQKLAVQVEAVPEEILAGQQLIRQSLRAEFHSTFAPVEETVVEKLPQGKIHVSGWVDLVLDNGIADRQNYSIVVSRDGSSEWVGAEAIVLPQR